MSENRSLIGGQLVEVKNEPDRRFRDAWVDSGDGIIEIDMAVALPMHKDKTAADINAEAEALRMKHLTQGHGQMMVYREKLDEAEEILAQDQAAIDALSADAVAASYPLISASVGIEAASAWDVAQLVFSKYQQWSQIGAAIENKRLAALKSVKEAADVEGVDAAYAALDWGDL
jgi:hypothetical protein